VSGRYRAQIASAVGAVEVLSATRHAWLGETAPPLPRHVERSLDEATARGYLVYNVANDLYGNFYCQGAAAPPGLRRRTAPEGDGTFVQSLSAANAGRGCWEPGWSVVRVQDGAVTVERDGLSMLALRDACRLQKGQDLLPKTDVRVRFPKELLRLSPGFYMALGDRALPAGGKLVRLYWHLTPGAAPDFVRTATRALNERSLAARLKVVNDPHGYDRCDAGVVYIRRQDFARARPVVGELLTAIGPRLQGSTPTLTKRLASGLAVAEDPGRGESFGLTRCELIAEGIVRAHERGDGSLDERVATVEEALGDAGVDADAPYLNAGSRDAYELA
jgi:hypothetical protein